MFPASVGAPSTYNRVLDRLAEIGGVDVLHVQHEYEIFGSSDRFIEMLRAARADRLARSVIVTLHTVYRAPEGSDIARFQREVASSTDAVIVHSWLQEQELYA